MFLKLFLTFSYVALSCTAASSDSTNFTDFLNETLDLQSEEAPMALYEPLSAVNSIDICPPGSEEIDGMCKCNLDLCEAPSCDMFLHLIRNGTDTPGNCCPLYTCDNCSADAMENGTCACGADAFLNSKGNCECIDQHKSLIGDNCVCDPNKCELPHICDEHSVRINVKEGCCLVTHCKTCPEDTYPKIYQSDEIEDKCVCFHCPENQCNDTHVPHVLSKGQNMPPQCCDLYKCVPKGGCLVNDITYTNGQSWMNQNEQNCSCTNGLPLCIDNTTDILVQSCMTKTAAYAHLDTWSEDACTNCTCYNGVPKCITHWCNITESRVKKYKDCLYHGRMYNHSTNWIAEDSCTNCTCDNGVLNCDTQACSISVIDVNNNCAPLDNCKRFCKNGFKINRKGCEICKCKVPERIFEKFALLETYMKSHNLSEVDVLKLLNQTTNPVEGTSPASAPPDQSKDCDIVSYLIPFFVVFGGILLVYIIYFCWKRRNACDYRPVSKTMDNNNLPVQGNIKYISEKSPLKT